MEELIKKALKGVGLPEGLHKFIVVDKEDQIASKVAELKKIYPQQVKKPETLEELLADEDLKGVVNSYKDKAVTEGIKTFVKNKGGDAEKLSIEIKDGEIVEKKVEKVEKSGGNGEVNLDENPTIKGIVDSVKKLSKIVTGQVEEKQQVELVTKVKAALNKLELPESFADNIVIPDGATDDQITEAVEGFQTKLNDANMSTLNEPGQGSQLKGDAKLEDSMAEWSESDEDKK